MKVALIFITFFTVLSSCSCFHYTSTDFEGTYDQIYNQKSKTGVKLKFEKNVFSLFEDNTHTEYSNFDCCDTITTGNWAIDNTHGILSLSNSDKFPTMLKMYVKEDANVHKDSIYFFISNPIEAKMGNVHKDIDYVINIDSSLPFESYKPNQSITDKFFNTNKIIIPNPGHAKLIRFSVDIIPKSSYNGRNVPIRLIHTIDFKIRDDQSSNVFYIDLPNLTYQFITYLRLNNDYLKIIGKDKLEWDGYSYIKSESPNKKN